MMEGKSNAGRVWEDLLAFFRNAACFRRHQRELFYARCGISRGFAARRRCSGLGASWRSAEAFAL